MFIAEGSVENWPDQAQWNAAPKFTGRQLPPRREARACGAAQFGCLFQYDSYRRGIFEDRRAVNVLHCGTDSSPGIYDQLGAYLELLLRWNAKTNLTAIRDPEQIVTRHFGESLFAAGVLFGNEPSGAPFKPDFGLSGTEQVPPAVTTLADLGSGAGLPGLPIKLAFPALHVTLIESQNKKATFLKEVIRALRLEGIEVYSGRAEHWGKQTHIVTLRAVEKFESMLPVAASLLRPEGKLCFLIGAGQKKTVTEAFGFSVEVERQIPNRPDFVVLVGKMI